MKEENNPYKSPKDEFIPNKRLATDWMAAIIIFVTLHGSVLAAIFLWELFK